jgi:hypothetical protein
MYTENTVNKLRSYLRRLANSRNSGVVSADDVHNFVQRNKLSLSQDDKLSLTRSVLNESEFMVVYYAPSSRPEAKGRQVAQWTLL